jgi:ParB-like chromosome segregation protein Spo0J
MPDATDPRVLGVLVEAKLQEWNISYEYVPAMEIDALEVVEVAQVRATEHRWNREQVEEYRQHMAAGAVFPPIVVMAPNMIIDGNTRRTAAQKARIKTLPAFVARFPSTALARAFAAAMNQKNGRRLSTDEARAAAQALLDAGYTEEAVALEVGYSRTQVGKWKVEMAFAERARRTGMLAAVEDVKKAQQHQIGQIKSDPVFAEVVRTVLDLEPGGKDVTELVKVAKEAHSDADALQKVAELRAALQPAGPPPHRPAVSPALKAWRMTAPQLLRHDGNPLDFLEIDAERRETSLEMWRRVRVLADGVLAAYGAH